MKLLMCCKQLKFRQHDRRLVVLVFAFATLSVNRIALRETGREIEMYPSASKLFGFCCCDCTRFCANLQKREIIQLPLPSAQRKPDPCPRIRARLGESIGECIVVVEAWRDPRPPGGRRHHHWQLVSAHSVIGTDSWPDTTESWRKNRPSRETQRVETKPGVRPTGDYSVSNRGVVYLKPGSVEVQKIDFPTFRNPAGKTIDHGVILKVVTTNICGSDQHMVRGRTTGPAGMVLGHEITGEAIERGRDVEYLEVGDLVSVPFDVACGRCRTCREGDTGVCLHVNSDRAGGGPMDMSI